MKKSDFRLNKSQPSYPRTEPFVPTVPRVDLPRMTSKSQNTAYLDERGVSSGVQECRRPALNSFVPVVAMSGHDRR